jgi:hypothetical protein
MRQLAGFRELWESLLERLALSIIIGRLDLCPRLIPVL